jgi:peptidoglycan/LPS O-acetylase OafA/YrhL
VTAVAPAGSPASRNGALDGMRAFAIVAVLVYHLSPGSLPSGFLGVDVFMAVSGFIVTELLLRERERTGRLRIGAFWGRRFRRLVPPVMVLVASVSLWLHFSGPAALVPSARSQGLAALVYVTNWKLVVDGVSYGGAVGAGSPLVHLWSLAVEEQFYLVWPVLLAALLVLGRGRRVPAVVVATVGAFASAATMALLYHPGQDPLRVYYGTDTRAQAFLLGAIAALIGPRLLERHGRLVAWIGPCALAAVAAAMVTDSPVVLYRGGFGLVAAGASLAAVATTRPGPLRFCLDRPLLRGLGRVSYGVYLWHWPAITLLTPARLGIDGFSLAAVRLTVTAVGTAVSWVLIERPFARWRPLRVAWTATATMGTATAVLVALPATQVVAYASYRVDRRPEPVVAAPSRVDQAVAASHPAAASARSPKIVVPALSRPGTAMIVGDSGMFSAGPAMSAGLRNAGWRVVETEYPGMGLTRPAEMPRIWAETTRRYHVDLTIVMIGLWDAQWVASHGDAAYRAVVDESVAAFTSAGGRVLWLSIMRGGINDHPTTDHFYRDLPRRHPGTVDYLDVAGALRAPNGDWPQIVAGHRLRQTDGWHLCPDGAAALTHLVLGHLGLDRVGWDGGAWRTDTRYDLTGACRAP